MGATIVEQTEVSVAPVDFRRPSRVGRDAIVALESTHDAFARRLSTAWSTSSYAPIEIEHVATDQLSIDDFVRSLPVPTALATVRVGGLQAVGFLQVDLPFGLLFVERILGGAGDPVGAPVDRKPTELESALLSDQLLLPAVTAIDEALRDLGGEASSLLTFETTPQPLQLGSPGELLLMLTYRVEIRGELAARGLVTLAYPVSALVPHLEALLTGPNDHGDGQVRRDGSPLHDTLLDARFEVAARVGGTTLPASALADLEPGNVIRLDHPIDQPAALVVGEHRLGTAQIGKRRRRVALQVVTPPTPAATQTAVAPETTT